MYIYQLDKPSSAQNSEPAPGPGPSTPSPGVRNRQHQQGGLKTESLYVLIVLCPGWVLVTMAGACICLVSPAVSGHYHWTRMSWSVAGWSWMAGSRVSVSRVQNQIVVIYGGAWPSPALSSSPHFLCSRVTPATQPPFPIELETNLREVRSFTITVATKFHVFLPWVLKVSLM